MRTPNHFAEPRHKAHRALIEAYPLATLIASHEGTLEVGHFPLIFPPASKQFILWGHAARVNKLFPMVQAAAPATAVFQGPNGYIAPRWYATPHQVSTWNFIAVHAQGRLELLPDAHLPELLDAQAAHFERHMPGPPWQTGGMNSARRDGMLAEIFAFALHVEQVDAQAKLSQNKSPADVQQVIEARQAYEAQLTSSLPALMQQYLNERLA